METIRDKIKLIKYHRLSEGERWILNLFDGMEMFYVKERRSSIFFKKNNMILFECQFNLGMLRINSKFINISNKTFSEYEPYIIEMFYNNVTLPKRNILPNNYDKVFFVSVINDESFFGVTL